MFGYRKSLDNNINKDNYYLFFDPEQINFKEKQIWIWMRLITFLIYKGRMLEAEKKWDDIINSLQISEEFYKICDWMITILLSRGEINFAQKVFNIVPKDIQSSERFIFLNKYLNALIEVEKYGSYTPAKNMLENFKWWKVGPFLLANDLENKKYKLKKMVCGQN